MASQLRWKYRVAIYTEHHPGGWREPRWRADLDSVPEHCGNAGALSSWQYPSVAQVSISPCPAASPGDRVSWLFWLAGCARTCGCTAGKGTAAPALELHDPHPTIAHAPPAVGAGKPRRHRGMLQTAQVAIRQDGRRWRSLQGLFKRGNGHVDLRGLHQEFHGPQLQVPARLQPHRFSDRPAIARGAIGGLAITIIHPFIRNHQLAMAGGNRGVLNLEFVLRLPADAINAQA